MRGLKVSTYFSSQTLFSFTTISPFHHALLSKEYIVVHCISMLTISWLSVCASSKCVHSHHRQSVVVVVVVILCAVVFSGQGMKREDSGGSLDSGVVRTLSAASSHTSLLLPLLLTPSPIPSSTTTTTTTTTTSSTSSSLWSWCHQHRYLVIAFFQGLLNKERTKFWKCKWMTSIRTAVTVFFPSLKHKSHCLQQMNLLPQPWPFAFFFFFFFFFFFSPTLLPYQNYSTLTWSTITAF